MKRQSILVLPLNLFEEFKAATLAHFQRIGPLKGIKNLSKESKAFRKLSWKNKACQNLLLAFQTTENALNLRNEDLHDRNITAVRVFWYRGTRVYQQHLHPLVSAEMEIFNKIYSWRKI